MESHDEAMARIERELADWEKDDTAARWNPERADADQEPAQHAHPTTDELMTEFFGEPIHVYTRAQALADGGLVEATPATVREAGIRFPVAFTAAAWADCVAWTRDDNRRQTYQDESGRLWDVLWMTRAAITRAPRGAQSVTVELYRVPRDGRTRTAKPARPGRHPGPRRPGRARVHHRPARRGLTNHHRAAAGQPPPGSPEPHHRKQHPSMSDDTGPPAPAPYRRLPRIPQQSSI
jgi:hypothetical protein